jgi:hypothetical protein
VLFTAWVDYPFSSPGGNGEPLGMLFIGAEIAGRIYLMATGIAAASGTDATKILIGGSIALALIIYVASHWKSFK